jgi:hypothetical protein
MRKRAALAIMALAIVGLGAAASGVPPKAKAPGNAATKVVAAPSEAVDSLKSLGDADTDLNKAFWTAVHEVRDGQAFNRAKTAANADAAVRAAGGAGSVQPIADMAISKPADVAQMISATTGPKADKDVQAAMKTAVAMRAAPATVDAAVHALPPAERAQATSFRANLSEGIAGLPGIYLHDNEGQRPAVPTGYTPVAGGSGGCPGQ